jgi:DNA-binding HxlR family transcriptional regulator
MRSYDEYCAIAKSLDVVGDRWTLLIVRELALRGPSRYTDLRDGLPGIATNLLAERLRDLERAGVIRREEAPPPVATALFHLTARGEQLRPVLDGLTHWGVPLMFEQQPGDAVRGHWLAPALELMLTDRDPDAPPIAVELHPGDQTIALETRDGTIHTRLGPAENPDLTLKGPPPTIMGLLIGLIGLPEAQAKGLSYEGEPAVLDRLGANVSNAALS